MFEHFRWDAVKGIKKEEAVVPLCLIYDFAHQLPIVMPSDSSHPDITYNFDSSGAALAYPLAEGLHHPGEATSAALFSVYPPAHGLSQAGEATSAEVLLPPPPGGYNYLSPFAEFNPTGNTSAFQNPCALEDLIPFDSLTNWAIHGADATVDVTNNAAQSPGAVMGTQATTTQASTSVDLGDFDPVFQSTQSSTDLPFSPEQLFLLKATELRYSQCNGQQRKDIRFQSAATIIKGMERTKRLTPEEKKSISKVCPSSPLTPLIDLIILISTSTRGTLPRSAAPRISPSGVGSGIFDRYSRTFTSRRLRGVEARFIPLRLGA